MRVIEHPFSDLLRQPKKVTDDVEDGDVVLRRRDEPDLRLSRADREAQRADTFTALGRVLRNLAVHNPAAFSDALGDAFPWVELLPAADRREFVDEFSRVLMAVADVDNYDPLSQLVHEWRTTAEIHADRKLARGLRRSIDVSGERIPAPEG